MNLKEVVVIVHRAKNLRGRKTKHSHKYSVIFGIDTNKFRTTISQSDTGCPEWKEESTVPVHNLDSHLVFLITDKEEVQGQITVPLKELPSEEFRCKFNAHLQPHKKCPNPQGILIYEAWITKASLPSISVTSSSQEHLHKESKIKHMMSKSPILKRKHSPRENSTETGSSLDISSSDNNKKHSSGSSLSNFFSKSPVMRRKQKQEKELNNSTLNRSKLNTSLQDLSSIEKIENDLNQQCRPVTFEGGQMLSINDKETWKSKSSTDLINEYKPDIRSITPDEFTNEGGTRITIRGSNLGSSKDDIVGLFICGANLLKTLEFISSEEICCVSKAWRVCEGHVVMETQSGGKAKSLIQVKVIKPQKSPEKTKETCNNDVSNYNDNNSDVINGDVNTIDGVLLTKVDNKKAGIKSIFHKENEKDSIIKQMEIELDRIRCENQALRDENATMRLYIDHLVARVMEECPETLQT